MADATIGVEAVVPSGAQPTREAAAAPSKPLEKVVDGHDWRISSRRALQMFGLGVGGLVATFVCAMVSRPMPRVPVTIALGLSTALLFFGVVRALIALFRMGRTSASVPLRWSAAVSIFPLLAGGFLSLVGAWLTAWSTTGFARGRQLRRSGKIVLPKVEAGAAWARLPIAASVEPGLRSELAAQWRENGRTEHASVAAFAQLSVELIVLGAPPELLAAASRDSLDEIRHAELCFSLARALDGKEESPAAFPEARKQADGLGRFSALLGAGPARAMALARLAVDSLVDGALHEGVSARVIAKLVRRCEDPALREVLRELAADEGRHAAHGWDVVEWCLEAGGEPVANALRGALQALPLELDADLPAAARDGSWEKFGVPGAALEAAEHGKARAELLRRVTSLVGATTEPRLA